MSLQLEEVSWVATVCVFPHDAFTCIAMMHTLVEVAIYIDKIKYFNDYIYTLL